MIGASQYQVLMLAINIGWILYNLIILFASIAVCVESVQQRKFPRVAAMQKVTVELSDGHKVKAVLAAFSQKDCQLVFKIPSAIPNFKLGESVKLIFGEARPCMNLTAPSQLSSLPALLILKFIRKHSRKKRVHGMHIRCPRTVD